MVLSATRELQGRLVTTQLVYLVTVRLIAAAAKRKSNLVLEWRSRGQGGRDFQNAGGLLLLHVSSFWMWSFPRMKCWLAGKGQLLWSSTSALNTMSDAQKNLNKGLQNGSFKERANTSPHSVYRLSEYRINNHWRYNCIQVSCYTLDRSVYL